MPASRKDIVESIANLRQIIDTGVTSTSVDGESTAFDLEKAKQRLGELENELAVIDGKPKVRPQWFSINMNRGFE